MKKVITPLAKEECVYFSDFMGKCFGNFPPNINLKIEFNYGSKYDGSVLELHLTDEEIHPILTFIKNSLTKESKIALNLSCINE